MVVVLPVPGGPLKIMLGMFPPFTTAWSLATVSSLPTTSLRTWGRYFSTQGCVDIVVVRGARLRRGCWGFGARRCWVAAAARAVLPQPVDHEYGRWRPAVGAVELYPAARFKDSAARESASVSYVRYLSIKRHL